MHKNWLLKMLKLPKKIFQKKKSKHDFYNVNVANIKYITTKVAHPMARTNNCCITGRAV